MKKYLVTFIGVDYVNRGGVIYQQDIPKEVELDDASIEKFKNSKEFTVEEVGGKSGNKKEKKMEDQETITTDEKAVKKKQEESQQSEKSQQQEKNPPKENQEVDLRESDEGSIKLEN